MQACGPGSSTPVSGETPDGWPCLADPDWASYTLGVFICLSCSGIHRNIPHVSKVKSVRLDTWEDVQVEVWQGRGGRWGVPARCQAASDPAGGRGGACPLPQQPQTQPAAQPVQAPACPVPREPTWAPCGQGVVGNSLRVAEGHRSQALACCLPTESRAHPSLRANSESTRTLARPPRARGHTPRGWKHPHPRARREGEATLTQARSAHLVRSGGQGGPGEAGLGWG